ncbi:MAG: cytochrome c3 family protein [Desulfobacterales bacterium]
MKEAVGGSNHEYFKNGKCLKCHNPHGSDFGGMIVAKQGFLCYSCHGTDPREEIKEVVSKHDPVVAGECSRCHSPHKANLKDLLLADYPDLCLTCHSDLKARMNPDLNAATAESGINAVPGEKKEAPAAVKIYVHAPSDLRNCRICHLPHFADQRALMVQPIQPLCGKCHDYKTPSFKTAHLNIDVNLMDCSKCHDAHTSTDPKFFKATVHKPFADRTCKDCHIVEKQ